jgi:hypothetical protein
MKKRKIAEILLKLSGIYFYTKLQVVLIAFIR